MKKHIVSALNFNILKTNLSKIASKEVKIYVFENYFLKKGVVQQLPLLPAGILLNYIQVFKYFFGNFFSATSEIRPFHFSVL